MEQEQIIRPMKKITGMLDILICLLLFISAIYKGGFYKEDSLFTNMVICMLGLVCLSVKLVVNIVDGKKITKSKVGTLIDICVILMPIAYFLPVLFGTYASKESAIFECTRYVNFAIVYFIVRTTSNKKTYLTSILLIGVVLAILGIDEITYRMFEDILSNLSINYLSVKNGKLSSTLQYANITALFMLIASLIAQSKLINNITKLETNKKLKFNIVVILELFSLILLQTSIMLTTSRMNILLMIITSIIYAIYCVKEGKKKPAITVLLMLVSSIVMVSSIDSYRLAQNNFMIIFTYAVTLLLIIIGVGISNKFKVKPDIRKTRSLVLDKKSIKKATILIGCAVVLLIVLFIPDKLTVSDDTDEGNIAVRNIYTDFEETMDIEISFDIDDEDILRLEIFEFDEKFVKNKVLSISQNEVENGKYVGKLNLKEDVVKLQMDFKTLKSSITIKELKLNGENITLSYMFLPDTIMFRIRDTFSNDSNNSLRYLYYTDSLKLFKLSPFVGIGGEGFKARYQEVQSESYVSSETHSVPMQILVEAGLIGFVICFAIVILTFVTIFRLYKKNKEQGIIYFLITFVFTLTSMFDIVFSFGLMIYLYGIIIGLVVGEYKKEGIVEKDRYELDNKSALSMIKIATLSMSLMTLFVVTLYSVNIYRASMLILPENKSELDVSYERVGILENKLKLDEYNAAYLTSLLTQYDTHIDLMNNVYLNTEDSNKKAALKAEIDSYVIRQKEIADRLVEYEYYNKYALEEVARCYFKHYLSYSSLLSSSFKNQEIAHVFYVGYAIKLTERLLDIGSVNAVAIDFAYNIYNDYIPVLERQNKVIQSEMLDQAIQDMVNKFNIVKEKVDE